MQEEIKEAQDSVDDSITPGAMVMPVSESGKPVPEQIYEFTPEDYWRKKQNLLWTGLTFSAVYFLAMIFLYL